MSFNNDWINTINKTACFLETVGEKENQLRLIMKN